MDAEEEEAMIAIHLEEIHQVMGVINAEKRATSLENVRMRNKLVTPNVLNVAR